MSGVDLPQFIQILAVAVVPVLFAITVHEVAHGWMALQFGDRTAEMLGRLTLNPVKHVDPVGTVLFPMMTLFFGGFLFGWAKPVPINPRALRNPKRDMIAVAAAGPGANLLMAFGWALLYHLSNFAISGPDSPAFFFLTMAKIGCNFNILLMLFNLLPIPPLDGSRVLRGFVPESIGRVLDTLERYGLIIVVGLIVLGLITPVVVVMRIVVRFLGVPALF
ncbi:MAG: site-2 protease family protein [Gammaproteobacteria bacterium]|nr:site-2 protease family protein [Gammaproteobacteria bacterium]